MKVIRWTYALPRLALVIVVILALRLGLDPLLRWTIVTSGEAAVGAKVEIGEVASSLLEGEVVLREKFVNSQCERFDRLVRYSLARPQPDHVQ